MLQGRSTLVVKKVMDKALDDADSDQMACLKILMDRMIPTSYFEKESKGKGGITIQIMGVGQSIEQTPQEASIVDVDFVEEIDDNTYNEEGLVSNGW